MSTKLFKKLDIEGICADDLDDLVEQTALDMASNANNGGLKEQLNFLIQIGGFTEEEIFKRIQNEI
jgi:hypothetical protein